MKFNYEIVMETSVYFVPKIGYFICFIFWFTSRFSGLPIVVPKISMSIFETTTSSPKHLCA